MGKLSREHLFFSVTQLLQRAPSAASINKSGSPETLRWDLSVGLWLKGGGRRVLEELFKWSGLLIARLYCSDGKPQVTGRAAATLALSEQRLNKSETSKLTRPPVASPSEAPVARSLMSNKSTQEQEVRGQGRPGHNAESSSSSIDPEVPSVGRRANQNKKVPPPALDKTPPTGGRRKCQCPCECYVYSLNQNQNQHHAADTPSRVHADTESQSKKKTKQKTRFPGELLPAQHLILSPPTCVCAF